MSVVEENTSRKDRGIEAVVQVIAPPTIEDEVFFPDGGLRAWLVVVGCFVANAVVIGFWYAIPFRVPKADSPFSSFVSVALT